MGTPLCSLPQSIPPPVPPFFPPPLFLLLPSTLIALHFILSSHHHSYKCSISLPILPAFSQPTSILSYQTQRGWGFLFFFFTTYLTIMENATLHTASSQPPDTTHDSSGHIFLSKIYSMTDFTGTNIHPKHKMKAVWCDVLPVGVHYSSVQTRPLCSWPCGHSGQTGHYLLIPATGPAHRGGTQNKHNDITAANSIY